jgi:hypothetical protein
MISKTECETQVKNKPKKKVVVNKINKDALQEFISNNTSSDKNLHKIDQLNVFENFFRINVWKKRREEGRVVSSFDISDSFFVELTKSGDIIDVTLRN